MTMEEITCRVGYPDIAAKLEEMSGNTETDPRWQAAQMLRQLDCFDARAFWLDGSSIEVKGLTPKLLFGIYQNHESALQTNRVLVNRLKEIDGQRQELIAALEQAVSAMQLCTGPEAVKQTTVINAWAALTEAQSVARAALAKCGKGQQ